MSNALTQTFDLVEARMQQSGTRVSHLFGWGYEPEHITEPTVVWSPGDDGLNVGATDVQIPASYDLEDPIVGRQLLLCSLWIHGRPSTRDTGNQRDQFEATLELRKQVYLSLKHTVEGFFTVVSEKWLRDPKSQKANHMCLVMVISVIDHIVDDQSHDYTDVIRGAFIHQQMDGELTEEYHVVGGLGPQEPGDLEDGQLTFDDLGLTFGNQPLTLGVN